MIQSPYTLKNMIITTPMTAAMEGYNWLSDRLLKHESRDPATQLTPILEKYFSTIEVRKHSEVLQNTLSEIAEKVQSYQLKPAPSFKQSRQKEDLKKEVFRLYMR